MLLKYAVNKKYMFIEYSSNNEDEKTDRLLLDLLQEQSTDQNVFIHCFRLTDENVNKLFKTEIIAEKARKMLNTDHFYFYLNKVQINVKCMEYADTVSIYYFDKSVDWQDFLVTSEIDNPIRFIKKEILSALFIRKGSKNWFICNRRYENRIMQYIQDMSAAGFEMKRFDRLPMLFLKNCAIR